MTAPPLRTLFRMRHEPLNLVVSRAWITDDIRLEGLAPAIVRLQKDRPLDVILRYEIEEASREQESYLVHLETSLDGQFARPQEKKWGDKWGWPHALQGVVAQRWRPTEGTHVLTFKAEVTYGRKAWGSREPIGPPLRRSIEGKVEVHVA